MTFVPTLNFNGKCREAMELYQKAFDGKVTAFMTYGEANDPSFTLTWELMKEDSTIIYPLESTFYSSARVVLLTVLESVGEL